MLTFIKSCWSGEAPLYKVFWYLYFICSLIVIFLADMYVDYFIAGEFTPFYIHNHYSDEIITLSFPYLFFSSMCVIACGRQSKWWWRFLARFIVISVLIAASFHLTKVTFSKNIHYKHSKIHY